MGNNSVTVTPQTDGISIKVGCKNVRLSHAIGVRNKRVNQPMTDAQKVKYNANMAKYKTAITTWAAAGGEGKAPSKPKKPTVKYKYVDYMGFEIKMKSGYDQAYLDSDDLLKVANAFLTYYEEVVEYEELANTTLKTMEKAYKAEVKTNHKAKKPTVHSVRARLLDAEIAHAKG